MARESFALYNIVAIYPDLEKARAAVAALKGSGVDAANISLLSRRVEEVGTVGRRTTVAGAAAGATAGFLAGALIFALPGIGSAIGTGIWVGALGGAAVGGIVGGLVQSRSTTHMVDELKSTYREALQADRALVGVHSDIEAELEQAIEVFELIEPLSLSQFDNEGRPLVIE